MSTEYEPDEANNSRTEAEILSVAKQLIVGRLGVIVASRRLSYLRHGAAHPIADLLDLFVALDSETDTLPIGDVRQYWSSEALERKDQEIEHAEAVYREMALETANRLVELLKRPS